MSVASTSPIPANEPLATTETATETAAAPTFQPLKPLKSSLRLLTCGSVDDGKSTLIGRLLWDATDLYDDQRATLENSGKRAGNDAHPDFSQLVDGLAAEREQGITIDIAWRYFDAGDRRFVVIDSPGHEQYTRNMASGASHADVAVMLVDARHGVKTQTRRHAAILDLMGLRRVVLAVNKMDLVDWSEDAFRQIEKDFNELTLRFGFQDAVTIPVSAVSGDNVAAGSAHMPWYHGPTMLQYLEDAPSRVTATAGEPFRMPVQMVLREGQDFRGFAGTISSGCISVGDAIADALTGKVGRVLRLVTMSGDLDVAYRGQALAIELDTDIDISRGAVLCTPDKRSASATSLEAQFVWLAEAPFDPKSQYLLRTATDLVPIDTVSITAHLDLETLRQKPAASGAANDIALATIELGRPTALDIFKAFPETGSFMIVDKLSGASVAGGVVATVVGTADAGVQRGDHDIDVVFTAADLAGDLNADLGDSEADRVEANRRADAVIALLQRAGLKVRFDT